MSLFESDTAVEVVGDHRFAATVTDRWNGLAGRPLGGYVLAVCLRALREVSPAPDLFIASAFYLNPVDPGPVEIHTEIARSGHRTATGEARLYQNGAEALRAVASFTDLSLSTGQSLITADPPVLPVPECALDLHDGGPAPSASIADRLEYRVAESFEQRQYRERQPLTMLWMRLKEGGGDDLLSIPFLVDAAPPAVMEIGATGSTTVELTVHVRARPRSAWLACRASTSYITDGYHEEDFEIWDEEGQLVAQSRQLARLPKTDTLHYQRQRRLSESGSIGSLRGETR
ncbi:MAG: thioesterase family protein [Acidimicrobiales bacterium]